MWQREDEGKERRGSGERLWGYIYTQSRTMIRKSAVWIPPAEIWVVQRETERGTDGEEEAGRGRGEEAEQRGGGRRGGRAVVLLIVVRCPEVQQRSGRPLGAPSSLLLYFSSDLLLNTDAWLTPEPDSYLWLLSARHVSSFVGSAESLFKVVDLIN